MTIIMIGQKGLPPHSGGIERHVFDLARGLAKQGHRVIAYARSWYTPQSGTIEAVEVRLTRGIHTKHLDAITHCWTALIDAKRFRPDIIHLHGTGIALLLPFARLMHPRAKMIVTIHCIDHTLAKWNAFAKLMFFAGEWLACHVAHRTIVVSQALARYCVDRYGCVATYIPHPFTPMTTIADPQILTPHGLAPDGYFLCVARLIPDKQVHTLIRAYAQARERHPVAFHNRPLVIVGEGSWTDPYVRELQQMVSQTIHVKLIGERTGEELRALQAQAYAHVLPSVSEGMAYALIEAASLKRPIVMTNLPQNREASGGEGVLVESGNVESLTQGLIVIATMPESVRRAMGERLHAHTLRMFHPQERTKQIADVYRETVKTVSFANAEAII